MLNVNEMPFSVGRWLDKVILNCLGPTSTTSVLSELRSRTLLVIQAFTSSRQASIFYLKTNKKRKLALIKRWYVCLSESYTPSGALIGVAHSLNITGFKI